MGLLTTVRYQSSGSGSQTSMAPRDLTLFLLTSNSRPGFYLPSAVHQLWLTHSHTHSTKCSFTCEQQRYRDVKFNPMRHTANRIRALQDLSTYPQPFADSMTALLYPVLLDLRKSIAFWERSETSPVCPSGKSNVQMTVSIKYWPPRHRGERLSSVVFKYEARTAHIASGL